MPYTADKPSLVPPSDELRQRIPGWGVDLDPADLPIWVQPWEMGHNPDRPLDAAILATRQAAFPLHGLDPWFD